MMAPCLWTVGHSTRALEEFLELLSAHGIRHLVDVRLIPYSRRNPQYHTEALAESLKEASLTYHRLPSLGGRRRSRPDSINTGWRNASFRGYADYMATPAFEQGLEELIRIAGPAITAIMCAEAVPWRCHRSLIADVLVSRGWNVRHIMTPAKATLHTLTSFARVKDGRLTYPGQVSARGTSLPF
jgi:uncharacterized protein (DUF488 family)